MLHVIIDADPVVYRAGFAAETHNYQVIAETPDGELVEKFFPKCEESSAGAKKIAWKKEHEDYIILEDTMIPDVEPLPFALRGVKLTMEACIQDAEREMRQKATTVSVLLSGPDNFRNEIATIKPYKGNRDKAYRPIHYEAIRKYMFDNWDARLIEGHEADDECSILSWVDFAADTPYVICTIDKDLDQIPGPHYDYAKKVMYDVYFNDASYFFWKQTLTGDPTDNIQGMFRVGDKAADKMLGAWLENYNTGDVVASTEETWEEYRWRLTVAAYAQNMKKYPEKYPEGMTAAEAALENARLVFMQTYPGQLWTPPGQPDEETT